MTKDTLKIARQLIENTINQYNGLEEGQYLYTDSVMITGSSKTVERLKKAELELREEIER